MDWKKEVKERDGYQCQFSKLFGISEITKTECVEDLEVHHITYKNFGDENLIDGITVCRRCHYVITNYVRELRHSNRELEKRPTEIEQLPRLEGRKDKENEKISCTIDKCIPTYYEQWTKSRPA